MTDRTEPHRTVLLLGSSAISQDGAEFLRQRLAESMAGAGPTGAWSFETGALFFGGGMAQRAENEASRREPDAVVLHLVSYQLVDDAVSFSVRRRWPRLYRLVLRVSARLKLFAGGFHEGAPGPRGWLFRLPRAVAARVLGMEPDVAIDDAIQCTKDTIDALLRQERVAVVCQLPDLVLPSRRPNRSHRERIDRFRAELAAYCAGRHVPLVDRAAGAEAAGLKSLLSRHTTYASADLRAIEAALIASAVLQALAAESPAPAGPLRRAKRSS